MGFADVMEYFDEGDLSMLIGVGALLGAIVVDLAARTFRQTTAKHAGRIAQRGLSGRHVAERLLRACGLTEVKVARGARLDVYRPWGNQIYLTDSTYDAPSVVSLAVAAHEVGHAQQFAEAIPAARLWRITMPLVIGLPIFVVTALMLSLFGIANVPLLSSTMAMALVLIILVLLQLPVHLPLERDASQRARQLVQQEGLIDPEELPAFDEILQAAWKTHFALHLQRWIMTVAVVGMMAFVPLFSTLDDPGEYLQEPVEPVPVISPAEFDGPIPECSPGNYVLPDDYRLPGDGFLILQPDMVSLALPLLSVVLLLYLLSKLEKWLKRAPTVEEKAVQHNNTANALQAQGKCEEAIAEFTRAIETNPNLTRCIP